MDCDVLLQRQVMFHIIVAGQRINYLACGFVNEESAQFNMLVEGILDASLNVDARQLLGDIRGGDMCTPYRDIDIRFMNEVHMAKESSAWIPTTALLAVLEANGNLIFSCTKCLGYITIEGIVAIWPEAHFLSINKDFCFAHGSIKEEEIIGRCRW